MGTVTTYIFYSRQPSSQTPRPCLLYESFFFGASTAAVDWRIKRDLGKNSGLAFSFDYSSTTIRCVYNIVCVYMLQISPTISVASTGFLIIRKNSSFQRKEMLLFTFLWRVERDRPWVRKIINRLFFVLAHLCTLVNGNAIYFRWRKRKQMDGFSGLAVSGRRRGKTSWKEIKPGWIYRHMQIPLPFICYDKRVTSKFYRNDYFLLKIYFSLRLNSMLTTSRVIRVYHLVAKNLRSG